MQECRFKGVGSGPRSGLHPRKYTTRLAFPQFLTRPSVNLFLMEQRPRTSIFTGHTNGNNRCRISKPSRDLICSRKCQTNSQELVTSGAIPFRAVGRPDGEILLAWEGALLDVRSQVAARRDCSTILGDRHALLEIWLALDVTISETQGPTSNWAKSFRVIGSEPGPWVGPKVVLHAHTSRIIRHE